VDERRVLILPPGRRDGEVTQSLLARHGLSCVVCSSAPAVAKEIARGAGALVLTDAALSAAGFELVLAELARQPHWADLPVILLSHASTHSSILATLAASLTNVTILDRPSSARALVSTVQTALRSRMRQYQTREQLEALHKAEQSLLAADRRKDEFLAMLAHELRGPLAPIRNSSELLARTPDAHTRSVAEILKRQTSHLSRLVDDLLDVSRITRGRVELQLQPINLADVLRVAIESVEPLMQQKRHTVRVDLGTETLKTNGDSARLVQCVGNVLTNSAKYTDPGGTIELKLRKDGDQAVVSVADDGVGIAPELLPHIFDLFVQADRSLDRAQGGLGIGLSVVKQLIGMHGGTVHARSDGLGQGTCVEMRVPLDVTTARPVSAPESAHASARRVLIVDDNVDAADSLAMLLKLDGHDAEPVYDPSAALQRVGEFDPEVILLDIGLPVMDGYEVARRLRNGGNKARLVALTGYGQSRDVQRAREAGFDSHLVKPVQLPALVRELAADPG
jgi:signal transduction histidine kinase